MAKLTGQTIDPSVSIYDAVYNSGGTWYTSDINNPPEGLYEGNNVVVIPDGITASHKMTFDSVFLGDELGTFTGDITINSDSSTNPDLIEVQAECVDLSLKTLMGTIDEEYEEYDDPNKVDGQYIDFDMLMSKNPLTNDIPKKLDSDSVMQSIKNILLNKQLWYGEDLDIYGLLFDNIDAPFRQYSIEETLKERILTREPRIGVLDINLRFKDEDKKDIEIIVKFTLNSNKSVFYTYPILIRIR